MNRVKIEPVEDNTLGTELDLDSATLLDNATASPELRAPAVESLVLETVASSREDLTRFVAGFFGDLGIRDAVNDANRFVDGLLESARRTIFGEDGEVRPASKEGHPIPVRVQEFKTLK